MKPEMRSFLVASISSFIIFVFIAIAFIDWKIKKTIDPVFETYITTETSVLPQYQDDLLYLRQQVILAPLFEDESKNGIDAGVFLNKIVRWIPDQPGFSQTPVVPPDIQDLVLRMGRNWVFHTSQFKRFFLRKRLDLKIFENLKAYSYWDVEKNSPVANLIKQDSQVLPEALPSLDSLDLIALCKLRLIQAVLSHDYLPALQDVRKMAQLLLTTQNFRLELTALSILETEHLAYNLYVEKSWIAQNEWQPIDSNITRRASRAIKATKALIRFWTPKSILRQSFITADAPIGFCSALGEALAPELHLRSALVHHLPFEREYSENYVILDRIWDIAKTKCRLHYLDHLRASGNFDSDHSPGGVFGGFPYIRKLVSLSSSANHFDGFRDYIEPKL